MTGANRHDSIAFEDLVYAIPAVPGLSGRPQSRPDKLHADKGYDFARCRRHLRKRGISPRIARRGIEKNDRLGKHRRVVERTHAWIAGFGKLRIRFERRLLVLVSMPAMVPMVPMATPVPVPLALVVIVIIASPPVGRIDGCRCHDHGPRNVDRLRRDIYRRRSIDRSGFGIDYARHSDANVDVHMRLGWQTYSQHRTTKRTNDCKSLHLLLKAGRA